MTQDRWLGCRMLVVFFLTVAFVAEAFGGVGDPQVATDHPWYPGELACSTFGRLADTQARAVFYKRIGR